MAFVPNNPFDSLPDFLQELFGDLPGTDFIPPDERGYAETLFAMGFGYTAVDYDRMGLTPETVYDARQKFFDYMKMSEDQFPWDEWRELHPDS